MMSLGRDLVMALNRLLKIYLGNVKFQIIELTHTNTTTNTTIARTLRNIPKILYTILLISSLM